MLTRENKLNHYADKIIKILKKTSATNQQTIWEVFINDSEIRGSGEFSKINIKLLDKVFLTDIKKMKKEAVVNLWENTEDGYIHVGASSPFMEESLAYEGDIILDIKNELIELIVLDIQELY